MQILQIKFNNTIMQILLLFKTSILEFYEMFYIFDLFIIARCNTLFIIIYLIYIIYNLHKGGY